MRRLTPLLLSMSLALTYWSASRAQEPPPLRPSPADMEARHAQRAKDLRTILRITPDQEQAFSAYVAATKPVRFEKRLDAAEALSTPDRLRRASEMEEQRMNERRRRDQATLAFYQQLKPDQREVFDAVGRLGPPPGMMIGLADGPEMRVMQRIEGPPPR